MASDAGGVVGPDVIAACGLSAVPGIGASSLARIAHEFGSLESAIGEGPGAILRANECRSIVAYKPSLLLHCSRFRLRRTLLDRIAFVIANLQRPDRKLLELRFDFGPVTSHNYYR